MPNPSLFPDDTPAWYTLFCDGGSRGNPGPAATGYALYDPEKKIIAQDGVYLGHTTNNVAEYTAVIQGLGKAKDLGVGRIQVFLDSKLAVEQIAGRWKVRQPHLRPLQQEARTLLQAFEQTRVQHIPREKNRVADSLVNRALDSRGR